MHDIELPLSVMVCWHFTPSPDVIQLASSLVWEKGLHGYCVQVFQQYPYLPQNFDVAEMPNPYTHGRTICIQIV